MCREVRRLARSEQTATARPALVGGGRSLWRRPEASCCHTSCCHAPYRLTSRPLASVLSPVSSPHTAVRHRRAPRRIVPARHAALRSSAAAARGRARVGATHHTDRSHSRRGSSAPAAPPHALGTRT